MAAPLQETCTSEPYAPSPYSADDEHREAKAAVQALDTSQVEHLGEFRRFAILTAAAFAMICASTSYAFNIFSGQLQAKYGFTSREMSSINTVGMVFAYFLMPYGFIYDYFGPRPIYCISCTLFSLGALLLGLTFQGVIEGSAVRFAVYNAFLSLGSQLFDLATVVTVLSIFPTRKGWVIALLKTLMGLGSAIIGSIQIGFFENAPANYFYFLIGMVVVVGTAVQLLIKLPPYHLTQFEEKRLSEEKKAERMKCRTAYLTQEPPMWRFYFGVGVILVLVAYLPTTSALVAFLKLKQEARVAFAIVAIVLTLLLLLMMVPFPYLDRLTTKQSGFLTDTDKAAEEEPAAEATTGHVEAAQGVCLDENLPSKKAARREIVTDVDYIAPQYQTTFLQSLCTAKLWCIFWTFFCGLGSEFIIIFNARFIYAALDGQAVSPTVGTLLTVLNGAGSALGRLAMSFFEMYTQKRKAEDRIPITFALFVPASVLILSVMLFLVLPGRALLVAYAIAALGNGFFGSIVILVPRTMYAKDPAKHYNFGINALVPAAVLLNRFLYGEWYAVQAEKRGERVCLNRSCVLMPMLVMLGINLTAFASTIYVHISYTRFSRRVLAERRRIKEEAVLQIDGNAHAKQLTSSGCSDAHPTR